MKQTLSNDLLTVTIDTFGAELQSIVNNRIGHEYLWQGDKRFWGRRSPVLFPIVGSVWNGHYRMDGREFALGQHGFARDREFEIMPDTPDDEAWFMLVSDESTMQLYPRRFRLEIGYRLQEARLTVMWRVVNLDDKEMCFQIGAHPAFNYPDFNAADPVHGYFGFDGASLQTQLIAEKGCVGDATAPVALDAEDMLPIEGDTFRNDAIVLADGQVHRVSMLDKNRAPYLSVLFQAPLVGLWSPSGEAPFVCIEPWWGRCDRVGFDGDFSARDYVNTLAPSATFSASYLVIFDNF
ncbi:aldose 1-epimerase family protein [uncultured Muribaculum sp.]|uniref:aldose 1-epimerase family protein n=1 Tax=uncultured Muribaculum sp. TaxID=1918613 RepID=UPI0025D5D89F|nr:aldose 1-epimerase family protein [uncultured Muribaculum sp.]